LRICGRPTKAEQLAMESGGPEALPAASPVMPAAAPLDELALAQRRIAELERKIGQQQVDLDFFQRALRHVREARRLTGAAGASVSTRSSKR
jgi:hypothetical protein